MNNKIYIALTTLGLSLPVAALAQNPGPAWPLDQVASVTDMYESSADPCQNEGPPDGDEYPIGIGSVFKMTKRGSFARYIDVAWDPNNVLHEPNLYVFNEKKGALDKDYCDKKNPGGNAKDHVFLFGIHPLVDPTTGYPSLHAFIYLPMRLKNQTPATLADSFYLMVLHIAFDDSDCTEPATKERCLALRRLARVQMGNDEKAFRDAITKEIGKILPDKPNKVIRYHNGVVHGDL